MPNFNYGQSFQKLPTKLHIAYSQPQKLAQIVLKLGNIIISTS